MSACTAIADRILTIATLGSEIKGISFAFNIRRVDYVSDEFDWKPLNRDEVLTPRTPEQIAEAERLREPRRMFRETNVGLAEILSGLNEAGFTLTSAIGLVRLFEVPWLDDEFGPTDPEERYRARFVFHRSPTIPANDRDYLTGDGEQSFRYLIDEAMWEVDALRNPLRNDDGFGWAFNCKARLSYLRPDGTPNGYRKRNEKGGAEGPIIPFRPTRLLKLDGDKLIAC